MALDAAGLPQLDDGGAVRAQASALRSAVARVSARAESIQSTWAPMAVHYDAPEAGLVHTAMSHPLSSAAVLTTKTAHAAQALVTYGDRLDALNAQRAQLVADIAGFHAYRDQVRSESGGVIGTLKEWVGWEDQDLLNREEALNDRCAGFAAAVDEAQRACANAITAIYGGAQYVAADRAAVGDPDVYGLSEDGYDQLGLSGENAWGAPEAWTETSWLSAGYMFGRGAVRSVTGLWDMGQALTGLGAEEGETAAMWSGLWQLGQDAARVGSAPLLISGLASDPEGVRESGSRLLGVLKSSVGIGTWQTSGWNTAGGFAPDLALALVTAGGGAAVKGGATGAARGAVGGALRRLAPTAATSIGDLNTALRAGMRARYGSALSGLRDLGYHSLDAFTDARRAPTETRAARAVDLDGPAVGSADAPTLTETRAARGADIDGPDAGSADAPTQAGTRGDAADGPREAPQEKVYLLMDGSDHAVDFGSVDVYNESLLQVGRADELLGGGQDVDGVFARNGVQPWSRDVLLDKIATDPARLSDTDRAVLNGLRDTIRADETTVMQKALTRGAFEDYLRGRIDARPEGHPLGAREPREFDPAQVGGFVARYEDVRHLNTPDRLNDGLRLDYPGSAFDGQGDATHVLRFRSNEAVYHTPRSSRFDPLHRNPLVQRWDKTSEPFTGNGFTKSRDSVVPEFDVASAAKLDQGAEVWEVLPDGTERLAAVLKGREWVPVG